MYVSGSIYNINAGFS